MKNTILIMTILFSTFSVFLSSCEKDEIDPPSSNVLSGKYEIYIDGTLYKKDFNAEVGRTQDDQGNYVATITIGTGTETSIVVSGFSKTVGGVSSMGQYGDPGVNITSGPDFYSTISGTLTRTSGSKISIDGSCTTLFGTQVHSITGYVESDAFEVIN